MTVVAYGKVLRSVGFVVSAIFFAFLRRKATNISESSISAVRTTASDKGQEQCYPWKKGLYHLHRVQFVASRLTIFSALPRTMDRSNAKLSEGVKRLF